MREFLSSPYWDWLTIAACGIGLVAALAFVVKYQREVGFGWWRLTDGRPNLFGRFLMIRKILLSMLFGIIITNRFTDEWLGRSALTAVLMLAFALHTFVPYRLLSEARKESTQEVGK
jgi:hypothetical protein